MQIRHSSWSYISDLCRLRSLLPFATIFLSSSFIQDASKSIEEVHQELVSIVTTTIDRVQTESSPLQRMWAEGEYELPEPNDEKKED